MPVLFVLLTCLISGLWNRTLASSETHRLYVNFREVQTSQVETNILHTSDGITPLRKDQEGYFVSNTQLMPISGAYPFITFTPVAKMDNFLPGRFEIRIRFSKDDIIWEDWRPVERSHEIEYSDTLFIGNMLFLDTSFHYFEYMIVFFRDLQSRSPLRLKEFRFDFFSPGRAFDPASQSGTPFGQTPPELIPEAYIDGECPCPLPAYETRTDWNCPDGQDPTTPNPTSTTVTHMIVHHSAGPNSSSNWAAAVLSIWNLHVNTNNWDDIGYNWLIDPNGVIYEGRGGGNNIQGAHFCSKNSGTMGICLMGNYETAEPTPEALESLEKLLAWKSCDSDLKPLGAALHVSSGLVLPHISGHKQGCNTLCPGGNLFEKLPEIRTHTQTILDQCTAVNPIDRLHDVALDIFPNPSSGAFYVLWETARSQEGEIQLVNVSGKVVYRAPVHFIPGKQRLEIATRQLPAGMYALTIRAGEQLISESVMIQ